MSRISAALRRCLPAAGLLLHLAAPQPARSECALSFLPIEESKYLLKGEGCEEAASVSITVDYDTAYLFAPEATVMGGSFPEEYRTALQTPGSLQLRILNEERSAALEATLYFQKRGDYPAVINFVTAEVADLSGAVSPVQVEMAAPANLPEEEVPGKPAGQTPSVAQEPLHELLKAGDQPPPASNASKAPPPGGKTVLERFREYSGTRTFAALKALFEGGDPCCSQTPPILVADGRKTARIVLSGVETAAGPPRFTVSGGSLVSARRSSDEEWVVVVRPDRYAWEVRLNAIFANAVIDLPLAVVPPIEIPRRQLAQINAKTFPARLQSFVSSYKGVSKYPVWLREYLFTANCLAARAGRER